LEYDIDAIYFGDDWGKEDDLIELGLNCFNPFQPEVMNIEEIHSKYLGRLAFYGDLSMQKAVIFFHPLIL